MCKVTNMLPKEKLAITVFVSLFVKDIINKNNFRLPLLEFGTPVLSQGVKEDYIVINSDGKNYKSSLFQIANGYLSPIHKLCGAILSMYFLKLEGSLHKKVLFIWATMASFVYVSLSPGWMENFISWSTAIHSVLEVFLIYIYRQKAFGKEINMELIENFTMFHIFMKLVFKPSVSILVTNILAGFSDALLGIYALFSWKKENKYILAGILFHTLLAFPGELATLTDSKYKRTIYEIMGISFLISNLSFTKYASKYLSKKELITTIVMSVLRTVLYHLVNNVLWLYKLLQYMNDIDIFTENTSFNNHRIITKHTECKAILQKERGYLTPMIGLFQISRNYFINKTFALTDGGIDDIKKMIGKVDFSELDVSYDFTAGVSDELLYDYIQTLGHRIFFPHVSYSQQVKKAFLNYNSELKRVLQIPPDFQEMHVMLSSKKMLKYNNDLVSIYVRKTESRVYVDKLIQIYDFAYLPGVVSLLRTVIAKAYDIEGMMELLRTLEDEVIDRFILECVRLYPPVVFIQHYDNHQKVLCSIYNANRDKSVWDADSEKFRLRSIDEYKNLISWSEPSLSGNKMCPAKDLSFTIVKDFLKKFVLYEWEQNVAKTIKFVNNNLVGYYTEIDLQIIEKQA